MKQLINFLLEDADAVSQVIESEQSFLFALSRIRLLKDALLRSQFDSTIIEVSMFSGNV